MNVAALFFVLGAILFALALHPFTTYPLSLLLLRKLSSKRAPANSAASGRYAVCMCVYNEEHVIDAKMKNLLALRERDPDLEILVYVDAASDRSVEVLQPYADRIYLHVSPHRLGKTHGMNRLVARTKADFVIFTDANVMLDQDVLTNLKRHFADPEVGCVCGQLSYINEQASITAATGSLYWRLEETIKSLEQASGSVMGADGSLFAIRRRLHHAPPDHIIDDMYVSLRILCDGYRIVQARDVKAYEKSATSAADEFRRKARIACQAFNVHNMLWPILKKLGPLTRYKYVSHKLLRWWSIYFLASAGVAIEAGLLVARAWWLAAVLPLTLLLGIWLGHRWSLTPFAQAVDALKSLAGAGLGVWQSLRGERYQTWQPAASVRD